MTSSTSLKREIVMTGPNTCDGSEVVVKLLVE
jgi:hypothetical protein